VVTCLRPAGTIAARFAIRPNCRTGIIAFLFHSRSQSGRYDKYRFVSGTVTDIFQAIGLFVLDAKGNGVTLCATLGPMDLMTTWRRG